VPTTHGYNVLGKRDTTVINSERSSLPAFQLIRLYRPRSYHVFVFLLWLILRYSCGPLRSKGVNQSDVTPHRLPQIPIKKNIQVVIRRQRPYNATVGAETILGAGCPCGVAFGFDCPMVGNQTVSKRLTV